MHSSSKHIKSSSRSKKTLTRRSIPEKATISYPASLAPCEDFVLFPETAVVVEKHALTRRERSQQVRMELIADGLLPAADNGQHATKHEKPTALQRAAKRRSTLHRDTLIHHDDEPRWKEMKLPPAPSPPRLSTPDLDDIDEDLWSCCTWSESSVESYIAASRISDSTH